MWPPHRRCGGAGSDTDFNRRAQQITVSILRLFVCNGCGTVQADIERPGQCRRCDSEYIEELDPETQAFDYFTGG